MVRKLIILGIDGMDWDVIDRYKKELPNLYGLMEQNNFAKVAFRISSGYNACMVDNLYGT